MSVNIVYSYACTYIHTRTCYCRLCRLISAARNSLHQLYDYDIYVCTHTRKLLITMAALIKCFMSKCNEWACGRMIKYCGIHIVSTWVCACVCTMTLCVLLQSVCMYVCHYRKCFIEVLNCGLCYRAFKCVRRFFHRRDSITHLTSTEI